MEQTQKEKIRSLIFLVGIIVLTFSIGFLPASWFGINSTKNFYKKLDLAQPASINDLAQDTNKDGEISWEELVDQTTFGGGVATDDSGVAVPDEKTTAILNDPNNLTTSFSKNVYLTSSYLKQYGGSDTSTQEEIVSKLLQDEAGKLTFTTYVYKDMKVDSSETPTSIKAYGNALGVVVSTGADTGLALTDIDDVKKYLENKDAKSLASLKQKSEVASKILEALLAMKIPPSAAPYHLVFLNQASEYVSMMNNVATIDTDPIRATLAFKEYERVTRGMLSGVAALSTYFSSQTISFSKKDTGYIFSPSYTIQ